MTDTSQLFWPSAAAQTSGTALLLAAVREAVTFTAALLDENAPGVNTLVALFHVPHWIVTVGWTPDPESTGL